MGVWIVSKTHIDALVTALITFGLINERDADATGKSLWAENHKSINYRYGVSCRTPAYKWEKVELSLPSLVKQVACYDYQTCERPTYPKTSSFRHMKDLLAQVARALISGPEYDNAPWGV